MALSSRRALSALSLLAALAASGLVSPARAGDDAPSKPPVVEAPKPATDAAKSAAIQSIVEELRGEAAKIRGLEWKSPVPADVMTRAQLAVELKRQIKEELKPDVYEREVKLARRLGMLTEKEDPIELTLKFLEKGIAGFYDPKTKHLYVIDGLTGDAQRPTMLHELIHALEDQHFDLQKQTDPIEEDGDRLFPMQCLQEGSAEFGRHAYEKIHPDIAKLSAAEQMKEQTSAEMIKAVMTIPAFLVLPTLLHYQTGPAFVTRAVGEGSYHDTMERLYADPPVSEEQVIHPAKYLGKDRDLPQRIAWPKDLAAALGDGWTGYTPSTEGEIDVALWLDRWIGGSGGHLSPQTLMSGRFWSAAADKAAKGWDGASMQLLEKTGGEVAGRGGSVVVSILAWDSKADAWEAAEALQKALVARHGDSVATAAWKNGDDASRVFDYTSPLGQGRIVVRDDVVRWLDGAPADGFERVWAPIAAAAVTRDPADTWRETDPLADVTWKSKDGHVGWATPGEGWAVERDGDAAVLRNGDLDVRLETRPSESVQAAALSAIAALTKKHPGATPNLVAIEEVEVAGKEGARIPVDDRGTAPEARSRLLYVIPIGDAVLLVTASAPKTTWKERQPALAQALGGVRIPD